MAFSGVAQVVKGFQFVPYLSTVIVSGLGRAVPVIAMTGLEDGGATIGTRDNNMLVVFSKYYYSNGSYIGTLASSDVRLKTNIRDLSAKSERGLMQSSVSDRVLKLRPVTYDFVRTASGEDVSQNPAYKNRTGFIAQEVAKLFPDLVAVDSAGLHSLDYTGLIPYLTQTIKEQNERIQTLEQQVNAIQTGAFIDEFDINMPNRAPQQKAQPANVTGNHTLHQNVPNPFNVATTINYQLAENATNAKICIYNLTGKQVQCYELPASAGQNAIEVRASSLQAGMYLYSLIVGNMLVDTKRMVLTE
ncbi:MAG: tail fiber domain-containing protein [Bacteroidales bacterium]|jgi:hypothetical protein|nr:tail fiber domain-containing protein [Bacteroidales bacterium]